MPESTTTEASTGTQPETNISAAMRDTVGTELSRQVSYPVSESDIRRWAIAVYWPEEPPAAFLDAKVAAGGVHNGIVAPEEFNPFAWAVAERRAANPDAVIDTNDPDNVEIALGIPGPGLRFQLNGGMETWYGVRMRPDDVITSVCRLGSYSERAGRLGLMLFSRTEDTWTNQNGELVKKTVNTLIRY
ncbi:FAS1-like dehydratase domain-containing protein [Pseudonocardia kunmingensis]|uniref:MaoC dehydratase-like protein n=1 Tax=Pseudonocardia kunmingensis TaxID=630975 RepID=A0A543DPJ6_9PSEU|nr:MaoC family dehydratase N-terminal domain-containing protein [Pseudonocardia kunmingensis]TQM11215.1 MaoC dehydratase-like protein [Pseudonocardia kunmingensis]